MFFCFVLTWTLETYVLRKLCLREPWLSCPKCLDSWRPYLLSKLTVVMIAIVPRTRSLFNSEHIIIPSAFKRSRVADSLRCKYTLIVASWPQKRIIISCTHSRIWFIRTKPCFRCAEELQLFRDFQHLKVRDFIKDRISSWSSKGIYKVFVL